MTEARLVVFAYSDLGHACLKHLLDRGETVAALYTHNDNPNEKIWFPSAAALARERGVPVRTPETLKTPEAVDAVCAFAPDLILSFYYRSLIPDSILALPRLGAFNMHGSLLPKFRGRAPVNWAVLHGETQTGPTLHVMTAKADAGDVVDQQAVPIGPNDTTADVQARVTKAAVDVLARQIENLKSGRAPRRAQNPSEATYFGRRTPEDGRLDWSRPARDLHNLVRAVSHPYPGAFTDIFGVKTYIWASRIPDTASPPLQPGQSATAAHRFFIGCGDGRSLEILRAQAEGGNEVDGADFARRLNLRGETIK